MPLKGICGRSVNYSHYCYACLITIIWYLQATVSGRCDISDESATSSSQDDQSDYELPPRITEWKLTEAADLSIKGCRIVDMEHIIKQLKQIALHPNPCTMCKYKYIRENKIGLFCGWIYYNFK